MIYDVLATPPSNATLTILYIEIRIVRKLYHYMCVAHVLNTSILHIEDLRMQFITKALNIYGHPNRLLAQTKF